MDSRFPTFTFFPAAKEEAFKESSNACVVCEEARGYVYTSSPYTAGEYEECICPWCVADGSAAEKLSGTFFDSEGVQQDQNGDSVSREDLIAIVKRTPSFSGWQQEQWLSHCGRPCKFIGRAGHSDLAEAGQVAVKAAASSVGMSQGDEHWEAYFRALDRDDSPTAYLFECLKCGEVTAYSDSH